MPYVAKTFVNYSNRDRHVNNAIIILSQSNSVYYKPGTFTLRTKYGPTGDILLKEVRWLKTRYFANFVHKESIMLSLQGIIWQSKLGTMKLKLNMMHYLNDVLHL